MNNRIFAILWPADPVSGIQEDDAIIDAVFAQYYALLEQADNS